MSRRYGLICVRAFVLLLSPALRHRGTPRKHQFAYDSSGSSNNFKTMMRAIRSLQVTPMPKSRIGYWVRLVSHRGSWQNLGSMSCLASHRGSRGRLFCVSDSELQLLVWSKNKTLSCKIGTGFLCGDHARHPFFARVIQQLGFWTLRKFKPTSTTATSGAVPSALRSALDSSIQAYAQTLVWPRRDVPRRFTCYFFQQGIRAQHEGCCSVCTLV